MKSEPLWYAINATTGADVIGVGAVLGVLALVLYFTCDSVDVFAFSCVAWLLAGTLFMAAHGFMLIQEHTMDPQPRE